MMPTEDDEQGFWSLLDRAWKLVGPQPQVLRRRLAARHATGDDVDLDEIDQWLPSFLDNLTTLCTDLSAAQLTDLDRVLERTVYDIDRSDIHDVTDGSDDGFLYCRGFIVATGRDFYPAVLAHPTVAILDAECGPMWNFFATLHYRRFGSRAQTGSGSSRESVSNPAGRPD
jgi:hypothetical protein